MIKQSHVVAALRVFLVLLFGVLVMLQTFSLPGQFAHMAKEAPEDAHLRWPATFVAAFLILCMQVVIVATWKLLTRVKEDQIFSDASFVWVDAIIGAIAAAGLVLLGVLLFVGFQANDPGLPLLLFLMLVAVSVLALLMLVMRALLRQATALRSEMETVI